MLADNFAVDGGQKTTASQQPNDTKMLQSTLAYQPKKIS
jgi:hypothetical protein